LRIDGKRRKAGKTYGNEDDIGHDGSPVCDQEFMIAQSRIKSRDGMRGLDIRIS